VSIRARLLLGLVALTALGLAAMAVVTYEKQRAFLDQQVDDQLAASQFVVAGQLGVGQGAALTPSPKRRRGVPPRRRPSTFQAASTYGELLGRDGRVLKVDAFAYGQRSEPAPRLPARLPRSRLGSGTLRTFSVAARTGSDLTYDAAAFTVTDGRTLVVAVSLRAVTATLHQLVVVEAAVGGAVVLALLVLGWFVIRVGLLPLERIGRVASEIAHGDLSRRVTSTSPRTEVGRLGLSLNEMLVQIEQAFAAREQSEDELRRFLADASHELRTPLASVRAYAEAFRLGAAAEPETLARTMQRIESEAQRMGVLVEDLLLLARLDQLPEQRREQVGLAELAGQAVEDARALAPQRCITISAGDPGIVSADADQLRQVLANLIRNALIHTPPDAAIEVSISRAGERVNVAVRDHGAGLPAEGGDKIFERFWRAEHGRQRGRGGSGLGLAIVAAIVHAHHGEVHAQNAAGGGAEIRVWLPAAVRVGAG
jgi:two-component system OmpR family sensor kinase